MSDTEDINVHDMEQQVYAAKRLQKARRARESLLDFIQFTMPDPNHPDDVDISQYAVKPHHRLLCEALEKVARGECLRLAISMPPQFGKQIADSVDVLTAGGWKKHGDLKVGDRVFGPDGKPTKVVDVMPPSMEKMKVRFTDGAEIICHPNHEWTVWQRGYGRWRTLETKELAKRALWVKQSNGKSRSSYSVAPVPRIEFPDADLILHPYVLGAWLGDGTTGKPAITYHPNDGEVVAEIAFLGYAPSATWVHNKTGIVTRNFGGSIGTGNAGELPKKLSALCVYCEKHIPEIYKLSSVSQRLELLAGLIDTDGYVFQRGRRVAFSNANKRLIDDVADVVRSLGWRATISATQPCVSSSGIVGRKVVYQLTFSPDLEIRTRIPRKKISQWSVVRRKRGVVSIEPCAPELGRCITVDRKDGLYLVGRHLIPTHNSESASRRFPAWYEGNNPSKKLMFGTYNSDFAKNFGDQVREIMEGSRFKQVFPDFSLRIGSKAKDEMSTIDGGHLLFLGRGGSGTGHPADGFLIDDPLKNDEEANSPTIREALWQWYTKVANTRCHSLSWQIIIQTRWHEDDLIGRLCDPSHPDHDPEIAKQWTYLNIPAIVEDPELADALGLEVGSSLWEERFSLQHLRTAQRMNPRGFEALYQGNPSPEDGSYFKAENLVEYMPNQLPKNLRIYGASDHALTKKQENDASCLGCVGVDENNNIWILPDIWWNREEPDIMVDAMIDQMLNHKPLIWWAEDEHIKKSVGPFLQRRMLERSAFCLVEGMTSSKDLVQRARPIQGMIAMNKVMFPKYAPWWPKARGELLKFPNATHDDFISFLSLIGRGLERIVAAGGAGQPKGEDIPKVGTIAWVRWAAMMEKRRRANEKAAGGY